MIILVFYNRASIGESSGVIVFPIKSDVKKYRESNFKNHQCVLQNLCLDLCSKEKHD